ncbi:hypothetical protein Tco_0482344 [Tanacetum coccineum]
MEEIDLFLASDDSMPPGNENDNYDSEGDFRFLEELLNNDSLPLPENESSNLDHFNEPSSSRPPPEPPDVEICFDFEPDTGVVTTKVVKGISEHYVLMPNILPTLLTFDPDLDFTPSHDSPGSRNDIFDLGIFIEVQSEKILSRDEFSISFIHDRLSPVFDTLIPFSSENEDKVFNPDILISPLLSHRGEITSNFYKSPMMISGGDIPLLDVLIPQDHEDPCLFSILQSSGLRSFVYSGILNPDHVQRIENKAKTVKIIENRAKTGHVMLPLSFFLKPLKCRHLAEYEVLNERQMIGMIHCFLEASPKQGFPILPSDLELSLASNLK